MKPDLTHFHPRSVLAYCALVIAGLGVLGSLALLIQFQAIEDTSKKQLQQPLTNAQGGQFVAAADTLLSSTTNQILQIAALPETQQAMASADLQMAENIRQLIPHASRVYLINRLKIRGMQDELGFALLDIASRAFKQAQTRLEAVYRNGEQRFYMAAPITGFDQQKGVLLIEFNRSWLNNLNDAAKRVTGTIVLQQPGLDNHGKATDIHRWGPGGYLPADLTRFSLNNGWNASIVVNTQSIALDALGIILPSAIVMILALLGCGIILGYLVIRVRKDHQNLMAYLHSVHRQHPMPGQYQLKLFEEMAHDLNALLIARAPVLRAADESPLERDPQQISLAPQNANKPETHPADQPLSGAKRFPRQVPDKGVFRAYDIRGLVETQLTESAVYWIARAVAAEITQQGHDRIALGWDGRHSSPLLSQAAERGLVEGGCRVLMLGEVPTGALYYATHETQAPSGMMITGSHNPPEYNGIKLVINRQAQSGKQLKKLYRRISDNNLPSGRGSSESFDIREDYLSRIESDVHISRDLKVVIDAGNGVAGPFAERLMDKLELNYTSLYCDVDGDFPNHAPDPTEPENLADLIAVVRNQGADLGLALDGDGDRAILVDNKGNIIWPDTTLMLLTDGLLQKHLGRSIIYDVKSTRHLGSHIRKLGGKPIIAATGHSLMKAKMKEHRAILGAEFSGHYYFADRWYGFDDGLYAAARILERLGNHDGDVSSLVSTLPHDISTPEISLTCADDRKFDIIKQLAKDSLLTQGAKLTTVDGLRIETRESWGLIRASNTTPRLTVRIAGDNQDCLSFMHQRLVTALQNVDPELSQQLEQALIHDQGNTEQAPQLQ